MIRKVSKEVDVKASISKAWEVYGSPAKVGMIIQAEMGHLSSVVVLEGDGGVGTVVEVTPRPEPIKINSINNRENPRSVTR
ncbi:hypothetical protein E3N88_40162 [Mikania micrantha]|uniref:Uncharacterized protein n=1 Tax=Mikania micrantha TaxID=192012 RepID=A0A5N6LLZ1_9ASTR|nr:hypothetical protein E3N88_40162 [Mikania micrantha]